MEYIITLIFMLSMVIVVLIIKIEDYFLIIGLENKLHKIHDVKDVNILLKRPLIYKAMLENDSDFFKNNEVPQWVIEEIESEYLSIYGVEMHMRNVHHLQDYRDIKVAIEKMLPLKKDGII